MGSDESELKNVYFTRGINKGALIIIWPKDELQFPTDNQELIEETYFLIYDGHFSVLIDAKTGDFIESGASSAARADWLNK